MLAANKSLWFEKLFSIYNKNLLKRRFNSLRIANFDSLIQKDSKFPLIIYANHSSWWDGLIAFEVSRRAKLDSYIMMEEKQLKHLQLFRKLGAFSVARESPQQAAKSLKYIVNLLIENPARKLWIFPQGEILPNDSKPLKFFRGLEKIMARLKICNVVPLAVRYEFLNDFKPDVFVNIGKIKQFDLSLPIVKNSVTDQLSETLSKNLDRMKNEINNCELESYQKYL